MFYEGTSHDAGSHLNMKRPERKCEFSHWRRANGAERGSLDPGTALLEMQSCTRGSARVRCHWQRPRASHLARLCSSPLTYKPHAIKQCVASPQCYIDGVWKGQIYHRSSATSKAASCLRVTAAPPRAKSFFSPPNSAHCY